MGSFNRRKEAESRVYRPSLDADRTVTSNFQIGEFACSDGTDVMLLHPALPILLEELRANWGRPVHVNSGFRTAAYNDKIGGADDSRHLYGLAADIVIPNVPPDEVATLAADLGAGGVGRYDTFTHVDVWGTDRRWDNRTE
jgi:uncharacterized protein YcbK (DUF882 family)